MTSAIFGLIGVVVGGLLTGGVQYALAKRRELADIRVGLRMVEADLVTAEAALEVSLEQGFWAGAREVPDESWRTYRIALAQEFTRQVAHPCSDLRGNRTRLAWVPDRNGDKRHT